MRKLFFSIIALVLFMFPGTAIAQSTEVIRSYDVALSVQADSSMRVQETIEYDFGTLERHGIFRSIPYKYKARGGTFALRISDIAVTNAQGQPQQFSKSTSGNNVVLKIGDPDVTVTGAQTYTIAYTVKRAINYFENDHDELYWNAIGTEWDVAIDKSSVSVSFPAQVTRATCYMGPLGSTQEACVITGLNTNTVSYSYSKPLYANEGFTVVAAVPFGTLAQPTRWQMLADLVRDNGIVVLPIVVFALMYYVWNRYGRDAKGRGTIVAQYDPPVGLSPLYLGTMVDGKVDNKDLSAELVYLAEQSHVKIAKTETTKLLLFTGSEYVFTKQDKDTTRLPKQSAALLQALFAGRAHVTLSELKKDMSFGKALVKIRSEVLTELTRSGFYQYNPATMRGATIAVGVVFGFAGAMLLGNLLGIIGVVAAIVSGLIIVVFSFIMPARTAKGAEMREYILGLKEYLGVAEADRLAFHNAPEKSPERFEMLLPFAIALGVETAWAQQFKDIYRQPSWYTDASGARFNALTFTSSINHFSSSVQSAMSTVTTSASGGSGFSGGGSGGGGGGGGGGSW